MTPAAAKGSPERLTQLDELGYVAFVDIGVVRNGVFRMDEMFGDLTPHAWKLVRVPATRIRGSTPGVAVFQRRCRRGGARRGPRPGCVRPVRSLRRLPDRSRVSRAMNRTMGAAGTSPRPGRRGHRRVSQVCRGYFRRGGAAAGRLAGRPEARETPSAAGRLRRCAERGQGKVRPGEGRVIQQDVSDFDRRPGSAWSDAIVTPKGAGISITACR